MRVAQASSLQVRGRSRLDVCATFTRCEFSPGGGEKRRAEPLWACPPSLDRCVVCLPHADTCGTFGVNGVRVGWGGVVGCGLSRASRPCWVGAGGTRVDRTHSGGLYVDLFGFGLFGFQHPHVQDAILEVRRNVLAIGIIR